MRPVRRTDGHTKANGLTWLTDWLVSTSAASQLSCLCSSHGTKTRWHSERQCGASAQCYSCVNSINVSNQPEPSSGDGRVHSEAVISSASAVPDEQDSVASLASHKPSLSFILCVRFVSSNRSLSVRICEALASAMSPRQWSRWRGRGGRALLALAALCACALRVPLARRLDHAHLPRAAPHAVAAHLADFNNLRKLYPYIESWRVEEQWSNYTSWQYALEFSCGARCGGRALVAAHDALAPAARPAHGHRAQAHRVTLHLAACRALPLLPWPAFCEELDVEWAVRGDGAGGAHVREAGCARAALAPAGLRWLAGAGAAPALPAHMPALRDAFV